MTSFTLKLIAVVTMLIDHIAVFLPGMPIWLRWIGRLSAPLFIFCCAWGFLYSKDRKKYLLRLYFASVAMSIFPLFSGIQNNFFRTLFSMCVIFALIELYRSKDKRFIPYLGLYLCWQAASCGIIILLLQSDLPTKFLAYVLPAIFGNFFYLEGGLVFVALGVLIYVTKERTRLLGASFIAFALAQLSLTATRILPAAMGLLARMEYGSNSEIVKFIIYHFSNALEYVLDVFIGIHPMYAGASIFTVHFQWMMIFALPLMQKYNHKKGRDFKWFFYVFYPLHIVLLYYIGKLFL